MQRFANQALAAVAALLIAGTSLTAIVTVPETAQVAYAAAPVLA